MDDFLRAIRHALKRNHLRLPVEWNQCDKVTPQTKVLHFTRMVTQPWKPYRIGVIDEDPARVLEYEDHPDPAAVLLWEHFARAHTVA